MRKQIQFVTTFIVFSLILCSCSNKSEEWFYKGLDAYDAKDFNLAIEYYSKVIEYDPDCVDAYISIGNAYQALNRFDKAISSYNKAIKLNPNYAEVYYNRGNTYNSLKEFDKAISSYNKAIKLVPNYTDAYNNRGGAHYKLKEYNKAIVNFTKAIELNPNHAKAYLNKGTAHYKLKEYNKSVTDLNEYLRLSNNVYGDAERIRQFIKSIHSKQNGEIKEFYIKDGLTYKTGEDTPYTGIELTYYPNGQVKLKMNYKNGKPHGEWFGYFENGKIQMEQIWDNGTPIGEIIWYDEKGNVERKIDTDAFRRLKKYYENE
ncbi:MAG: tetratricopeptide repeat protein [Candidatus Delongbacteria bacterium]|nr:tetratricopeptide repeat protein [Candidatus Delongbacteria bacterium]